MNAPSSAPCRRKRGPTGSRRTSATAPSTSAAVAKRAERKTPGEATSSTPFTKWKVVPQNRVRTRRARSAMPLGPDLVPFVEPHGRLPSPAHAHVQELDPERERHGEVDVALLDVLPERLGDEHHADQDQEREREH